MKKIINLKGNFPPLRSENELKPIYLLNTCSSLQLLDVKSLEM